MCLSQPNSQHWPQGFVQQSISFLPVTGLLQQWVLFC